ncbi:MAG: hypothetical protein KGH64_00600 [Candidatus Micrarchaeota archaeon]|nr:hypothetical protein [Candidatus Micrarchaeota archaeon]
MSNDKAQEKLDNLMLRILVFVDRNGKVVSKNGNRMSSSLSMAYVDKEFDIKMSAFCHCMGNGSCSATVRYKGALVFNASGSYTSGPYGVKAKTYECGDWENKFPKEH